MFCRLVEGLINYFYLGFFLYYDFIKYLNLILDESFDFSYEIIILVFLELFKWYFINILGVDLFRCFFLGCWGVKEFFFFSSWLIRCVIWFVRYIFFVYCVVFIDYNFKDINIKIEKKDYIWVCLIFRCGFVEVDIILGF